MIHKSFFYLFLIVLALASSLSSAAAQDAAPVGSAANPQLTSGTGYPLASAFRYQGRLVNASGPVNGVCDFQFTLWETATGTADLGTQTRTNVSVTNGLFTVPDLDYGFVFHGFQRWLGIAVRCPAGTGSYTTLAPRQELTAVPNALYAANIPLAGSGRDATAARSDHDHDLAYWKLGGNDGLTADNAVLGTNTEVTLTFTVNRIPVLRLTSSNIVAGNGYVAPGAKGVTLFAGICGWSNVTDDYGTVSGGCSNRAGDNGAGTTDDAPYATVGGGVGNFASDFGATIAGGYHNYVTAEFGAIGGGEDNEAADDATVAGGRSNTATGGASTIGGGGENRTSDIYATISGGVQNVASGAMASVPGGSNARASHYGELAYASGTFGGGGAGREGGAQTSLYVLRQWTTTGAPTALFLDGAGERLTIAPDRTVTFDILVAARSNTNLSAGYQIRGVIENMGGPTRFIGIPAVTILGEQESSWDVTVQADDTNDALNIVVTGINGLNVRWVATVRTAEVAW